MSEHQDRQSSASLVQIPPASNPVQQWIRDNYGTFRGLVRLVLANAEHHLGRLKPFDRRGEALRSYDRLVFVCQGNICRSAYADAKARDMGLPSASLGLSTASGQPAFRLTREAAERRGIDMSRHSATDISDFAFAPKDLLLVMEVRQARQLASTRLPEGVGIAMLGHWASPPRLHIHDPYELEPGYFDKCFDVVDDALMGLKRDLEHS
jgi:protein-tyrosine phosphatase